MARYVAFLRAINTPGRNVKMDRLRAPFVGLGYQNVDTFIASGNVIFDTNSPPASRQIEAQIASDLGFDTLAYLRTADETIRVADLTPFAGDSDGYDVSFLPGEPDPAAVAQLLDTITGTDQLAVVGREVYWLLGGPREESDHKEATTVKLLGMPTTRRAIRTVRRIADKYLR